jgi:DNA repair exonuclease SbcCD ATPase subunit
MLRKVELLNFKNFVGCKVVTLLEETDPIPLVVIVGKNGNGKSCIIDAIEWTLSGDSDSKTKKSFDAIAIINNRCAEKFMSVKLTFVHPITGYEFLLFLYYYVM